MMLECLSNLASSNLLETFFHGLLAFFLVPLVLGCLSMLLAVFNCDLIFPLVLLALGKLIVAQTFGVVIEETDAVTVEVISIIDGSVSSDVIENDFLGFSDDGTVLWHEATRHFVNDFSHVKNLIFKILKD